ncbi:MAG: PASTA domain-containing protein [Bacteroidota bacterium]|nr:PASTA domain-containing protein [Bacteroidota bacterium]
MSLRSFLSSQRVRRCALIAAGAVLFVLLLDMFILPWIVHWRSEIPVPNVCGMHMNVAWRTLEYRGLKPVLKDTVPDDRMPPGMIVYQNPAPFNVVREGRNVYLTVSGGEKRVTVPNLRGRSLRDAKITLEQLDLQVGTVTMTPSPFPVDIVVTQDVLEGRNVPKGTRVGLTVSSGPEVVQQDVPALIGLSFEEAQKRLAEAGLRVGTVTYRQSRTLVPNTVISQSPAQGDKVDPQTPIDLVISH